MADAAAAPKKHLALDTDWMSAVIALCAIFIFGLLGTGTAWMILQGKPAVVSFAWWTPLIAVGCIYSAVVLRDKRLRIVLLIDVIGPLSRTVLWLARGSADTQLANEIFVRWIDTGLYLAICAYAVYWLKTKLRHV